MRHASNLSFSGTETLFPVFNKSSPVGKMLDFVLKCARFLADFLHFKLNPVCFLLPPKKHGLRKGLFPFRTYSCYFFCNL
jgi:hypothetical protein